MVFALAGDSTITSGLPPGAAVRLRGARLPVLVADVVLVGGTVLLSGVLTRAPGGPGRTRGQRELHPFGEATVGHAGGRSPGGEQIRARRRSSNGRRTGVFPRCRPARPPAHPGTRTPA